MSSSIERRGFLGIMSSAAFVGLGVASTSRVLRVTAALGASFPRQDPDMVQEMVSVSHGNLTRVKQLVEAHPALARASFDWGFGDWEDALGAASHTGRYEIAELLIKNGARPTIFSAAMMGQLATVKAFTADSPGVQRVLGPHGITLLSHAKAGGDRARPVREYLESLGDADTPTPTVALDPSQRSTYVGSYSFGSSPADRLDVVDGANGLTIVRPGVSSARGIKYVGDHQFFPVGAEAVRIRFAVTDGKAASVTVFDPDALVTAMRSS
jgi:hypothetical protein